MLEQPFQVCHTDIIGQYQTLISKTFFFFCLLSFCFSLPPSLLPYFLPSLHPFLGGSQDRMYSQDKQDIKRKRCCCFLNRQLIGWIFIINDSKSQANNYCRVSQKKVQFDHSSQRTLFCGQLRDRFHECIISKLLPVSSIVDSFNFSCMGTPQESKKSRKKIQKKISGVVIFLSSFSFKYYCTTSWVV